MSTPIIENDAPAAFSLNGIACVVVGLIAVAVCNLTGSDSVESLIAFIAATYAADKVMPFKMK